MPLLSGCTDGLRKGTVAPDFHLTDLSGKRVMLSRFPDNVVLLCFWAVGCPPCRTEAVHLKSLHERYGRKGLRILAVNAWDESRSMVADFARKNELPYTILLSGNEVFSGRYKGRSIPATYLLDRSGKIIYVHHGWGDGDERTLALRIEKQLQLESARP